MVAVEDTPSCFITWHVPQFAWQLLLNKKRHTELDTLQTWKHILHRYSAVSCLRCQIRERTAKSDLDTTHSIQTVERTEETECLCSSLRSIGMCKRFMRVFHLYLLLVVRTTGESWNKVNRWKLCQLGASYNVSIKNLPIVVPIYRGCTSYFHSFSRLSGQFVSSSSLPIWCFLEFFCFVFVFMIIFLNPGPKGQLSLRPHSLSVGVDTDIRAKTLKRKRM